MQTETQTPTVNPLLSLATEITSAYVQKNSVPQAELGALLISVHATLQGLSAPQAASAESETEKPTPAQIRKSIRPDGLISFIDGKSYKTLKRHLTKHGLDLVTYRQRYGLPADYPSVAANYAAQRSHLARSLGLGLQRRKGAEEEEASAPAPTQAAEPETKAPAKGRGGRKAATAAAASEPAAPAKGRGRRKAAA